MRKKIITLAVVVLGAVATAAVGFALFASQQRPVDPFSEVLVSGMIRTEFTVTLIRVDFASGSLPYGGGAAVEFSAPIKNGSYSVVLPNRAAYTVTVNWSRTGGGTGTCAAGVLDLNVNASFFALDIDCR